ncbi:nucleotide binding protein, putative [Plasmodium sp. gorilla clade G1]|nr:nucleotide binding protein, putative [Plasmodium sp. gorilla clade G1]
MIIWYNYSVGCAKNFLRSKNYYKHYHSAKLFQRRQFSLFNNKDKNGEANNLNNRTDFIQLYRNLIETKKIEHDPYQFKLILILQALENNLNKYYHNVQDKKRKNMSTEINNKKKSFLSSWFCSNKYIDGKDHSINDSNDEPIILDSLKNDDSFFLFDNDKYKNNKDLKYHHIKDEKYFMNEFNIEEKSITYIRGLYIYGSVGRGKTYFLNLLFDRIKLNKLKMHYHNFMQEIHRKFHEEKMNNSEDPIKSISIKMSEKYKVIFIDEFQVVHISDAMVIKSLFNHLFYQGTILLCTSNRNPIHLYHNGLNRDRFLPFIQLLFKFNYIFEIDNYHDFRLKNIHTKDDIYTLPNKTFEQVKNLCIDLYCRYYNKDINYVRQNEKFNQTLVVSNFKKCIIPYMLNKYSIFSFQDLCSKNVSIDEYNAISNNSHTIFIHNIEKMNEESKGNEMRRFILLIDILYEKNTKVFFYSNIPLFQIFQTNCIISHFQNLLEKMKSQYDHFKTFKESLKEQLKDGTFNREIFGSIMLSFDTTTEISDKLFDAINYNINKEYIPLEYLRRVLCFHIMNYEIDIKGHLKFLEDEDLIVEPIPYLLFDENDIDTSQENTFASMRTLSRMKHMCTSSYLDKHKKLYEKNI